MSRLQVGKSDEGKQALARVFVEDLESVMCENPVFADHCDKVGGYADYKKVKQGNQCLECYSEALRIRLYKFESYSAAAQVIERISAVRAFRVKHGNGGRYGRLGKVMVADYDIYALFPCIFHLVDGLDSAIEGDYQREGALCSPVYAFERHSVSFVVAVWDIKVNTVGKALDETVNQCYGGGSVNVVISVNKNLFLVGDSPVEAFHGDIHILHQERVVKVLELWTEKGHGLLESFHSPGNKKLGQHLVNADLGGKTFDLCGVGRFLDYPFASFCHNCVFIPIHKDNQLFPKIEKRLYFCSHYGRI